MQKNRYTTRGRTRKPNVYIVQGYIPQYRVPLFEKLHESLLDRGFSLILYSSSRATSAEQRMRGDSRQLAFSREARRLSLTIFGVVITIPLGLHSVARRGEVVVVPLEGSNLETFLSLFFKWIGYRVVVWGHVRPYISKGHRVDLWLERLQMRVADHVLAYTVSGKTYASQYILEENVTAVMNSLDVEMILRSMQQIRSDNFDVAGNERMKNLCFVGGLDASKRIDFLARILDIMWEWDKEFCLLLGGAGAEEWRLVPAINRGQVIDFGYANDRIKAKIYSLSAGIIMPGRVGLIAVEALAVGLPILTTAWPYHAPEFEYLEPGLSCHISPDDPKEFARLVCSFLACSSTTLRHNFQWWPSINEMVENFLSGVITES